MEHVEWVHAQADEACRVAAAVRGMAGRIAVVADVVAASLRRGGKVLLFGNGGSAAGAQHWAAELCGRFRLDRAPLAAVALAANACELTAVANDYGYDEVFARPLAALGRPGDVAVALSTSGRSTSVLRALDVARAHGLVTVGFSGATGGRMAGLCDHLFLIPSADTARIQEGHELCGHLMCGLLERIVFFPELAAEAELHAPPPRLPFAEPPESRPDA